MTTYLSTQDLGDAFAPNRAVSRTTVRLIIAVQAAIALAVWWLSPWEVLPRPNEVAAALGNLWMNEGLGRELFTSFALNFEALVLTTIISLGLAYLTVVPAVRPLVSAVSK